MIPWNAHSFWTYFDPDVVKTAMKMHLEVRFTVQAFTWVRLAKSLASLALLLFGGGVAATLSAKSIKKVEVLDMEELGMEAVSFNVEDWSL